MYNSRHPRRYSGSPPAGRRAVGLHAALLRYDLATQQLLRCPSSLAHLLGYSERELLRKEKGFSSLLHPDSLAQLQKADLTALLAGGRVLRWVGCLRHHDGSWCRVRFHLHSSAYTAAGTVREVAGYVEDVTRHHAAVTALRVETSKMQRLLNVVPTIIYVFELTGQRSLYCGPRVAALLGYTDQEIIAMGNQLAATTMEAEQAKVFMRQMAEVAGLRKGETRTLEYAVRHRDGSMRWLHATHTPYEHDAAGRVTSVLGAAEEVTERRRADDMQRQVARRLTEQHFLFRRIIDALPHPIYLKNSAGSYVLANNALAALYGATPEELVRFGATQPTTDDTIRYVEQDLDVLATGRELTQEETFTQPSGEVLWFMTHKRPFTRADGTRLVLGVDTNITELKNTQLALEAARQAAEANARAKEDFLANMSHEIRTPLHGIIGLTEVLAKTPLNPCQQEHLRLLGSSATHLLAVLDDVLTTSRLGAGKLRVEASAFRPAELLESCAALLRPYAHEKSLELRVEVSRELPSVWGDAHRLKQVLLNLLSNALKFTEAGEVVLRCEWVPPPLDAPALPAACWLRFSVADTGIGISAEAQKQIFEPFTQASTSTDRLYGGSGLGLSISQGLVRLLGGELLMKSKLGAGSTFDFVVPCTLSTASEPSATPVSLPADALKAGRVLVVEDNAVNSLLVETMLSTHGWEVTVASNGPAAIQLFASQVFEVVLMDIQMPGMDGETAAQALRTHPDPARAATPVVALTARAQPGEAERLRQAGFAGYLAKPFHEQQLLAALRTVLTPLPHLPPSPTAAEPPYNLALLRTLLGHDEAAMRRMVRSFITSTPAILAALNQAWAVADLAGVSEAAHSLKSSLPPLGVKVMPLLEELENGAAGALKIERTSQLVAQVSAVTEQVLAGLRMEFGDVVE